MSWSSLYLLFCATVFCFYYPQFSVAGNNETDRLALLHIKAQITDDPLGITSSWNDTLHFCEWHGVICGHKHKRVVVLDLHSSKLTGSLSPHMGNLTFLRGLYLQNNSFIGSIPSEIGYLHRLQYLALFDNSLSGEIPSNLSSCYSLIKLSLVSNKLVGEIPPQIGSLSHLQFLSLAANYNLVGTIPSSLGNLSSLVFLSIGGTNLVGKIPDSLGKLNKMTYLALSMNKLSGEVPPSIFNLSLLFDLDLGENQLEGSLPVGLGIMLPYLKRLLLSENQFTGSIPSSISNSSNLEVLQLTGNHLRGQVPSLHQLRKVSEVTIAENLLGNGETSDLNFVYSLGNSTMLQIFAIDHNNFRGVFPQVICNFSGLTFLVMGSNKISGQIPTCIRNLVDLTALDVSVCQLSGIIPVGIGELKNLYVLDLSFNRLSGHLPTSIGNLTQLSRLALIANNLEGQIPSTIGNCQNLQVWKVSYNKLSGRIPSQIFTLSSLSIILDLSQNHLTGPLPAEVGELTHLTELDISGNMISGAIPSSLSACVSLVILNMAGNFFQGSIPPTLNALAGLQELNLSHNNLSGGIPDFLVKFQLQRLDLSDNNLEGEVPTGGIFNNATGLSLSGNRRLCGGIPELKLPECNFWKTQKRNLSHKAIWIIAISSFSAVILLVAFASLYVFFYRKRRKEHPTSGVQDSGNTLSNLSYQSLLKATNGFASESLIGSGTFGVVYKGTFDEGQTVVAIKKFNLEHRGASKSFMAECEVLRNIKHRNLVKVITVCSGIDYQGNDFKALVYEYMVNGSLDDWLHPQPSSIAEGTSYAPRNLSLLQRLDIAVNVAFALEYLHHGFGAPIVHCDLKPSNVLLDDEMVAHVGDFGLAKFLPEGSSSSHANQSSSVGVRGTVGYTPPEYGLGNEISKSGDVYSFGILLLEMFTGKRPTDNMFKESLSLHSFVKAALPEPGIEIFDNALLKDILGDETITMDTQRETRNSKILLEALISVLEIALSCSAEVPQERLDMKDVVAKLSSIRNKLFGTRIRGQRRAPPGRQS